MPANTQRPQPYNYSDDLLDGRRDLQADAHFFFDTLFAGCRVLDVGAGHGRSKARIRHNRVTTYDIDARLAPYIDHAGGEPPLGPFDVVTAFDVLEHVEDDVGFLRELDVRASRAIFVTTPNWHVKRCVSTHHWREYTPEEFAALTQSVWPAGLIFFAYYKDAIGGWFDAVPRRQWDVHAGRKHAVLACKWSADLARIHAACCDRLHAIVPAAERTAAAGPALEDVPLLRGAP